MAQHTSTAMSTAMATAMATCTDSRVAAATAAAHASASASASTNATRGGSRFMTSDNDAEDYYDFIPSDSDRSDVDDDDDDNDDDGDTDTMSASGGRAAASANVITSSHSGLGHDIATAVSSPLDDDAAAAASRAAARADTSAVLTPIGVLGGARRSQNSRSSARADRPTHDTLARVASSGVMLAGGKELRVSPRALAQHASRRSQLESALDALLTASVRSVSGDAPFRFRLRSSETKSPTAASEDVEMAVDETAQRTRRRSRDTQDSSSSSSGGSGGARAAADAQDASSGGDPLYDESMDDADEAWVQRNFRVQGADATDATLCCPCCFLPVCLDCQRHVTYTNQYRASVAVNCRIKRDEVLTYARDAASVSALPFAKRLDLAAARSSSSSDRVSLLTPDEFHPVACSDCGTTVGVLDRAQQYHFFNILPSTC